MITQFMGKRFGQGAFAATAVPVDGYGDFLQRLKVLKYLR